MATDLPQHIAIIMDGNGRWAQRQGKPRSEGHRAGATAVRAVTRECRALGIRHLTLYTFSRENWNRPPEEVATLFDLLVEFVGREVSSLIEQDISLKVLGEVDALPLAPRTALRHALRATTPASGVTPAMVLNLALNYGGRAEIVRAAQRLLASGLAPESLTEERFAAELYTAGQPDPDLVIRTSGELRTSNFLPYQCAYSELYFTPILWPDFDAAALHAALDEYAGRHRRFGKTQEQLA